VSFISKNACVCCGYIGALCAGASSFRRLPPLPLHTMILYRSHASSRRQDINQQQNLRASLLPHHGERRLSSSTPLVWRHQAAGDACRQRVGRKANADEKLCRSAAWRPGLANSPISNHLRVNSCPAPLPESSGDNIDRRPCLAKPRYCSATWRQHHELNSTTCAYD